MKKNNKGFTLAELLIVVAIIALLVAVSIPVFTSQLEKSREATDIANMRAARAAAVSAYLSDDTTLGIGSMQTAAVTVKYDATSGKLVKSDATVAAYGKGTTANGNSAAYDGYENDKAYTAWVIYVTVAQNGDVTLEWKA